MRNRAHPTQSPWGFLFPSAPKKFKKCRRCFQGIFGRFFWLRVLGPGRLKIWEVLNWPLRVAFLLAPDERFDNFPNFSIDTMNDKSASVKFAQIGP
jgi:hypothetical protein